MAPIDSHHIDDFLLGNLSPDEHLKFEQAMKTNDILAQQVQKRRETISTIELLGDYELKKRVQQIHRDNMPIIHRRKRMRVIRWALLIAAMFVLLITSYQLFDQPASPDQLFAANFEAYPLSFGNRSQEDQTAIIRFSDLYQQKKYTEATLAIKNVPDTSLNSKLSLAKGISLLADKQAGAAQAVFNQLVKDPIYSEQGKWYLALTYLQQNQLPEAQQLLKSIQENPDHFNHQRARSLLKELEDLK